MVSVPPLLSMERVVRRFGGRTVLSVEQLSVDAGEVLAVVGPNGAGKSTLFRTLLLLDALESGVVRLDGVPMRRGDRRARGRLAGVFQRPVLFTGSVRDNVSFGLRATGLRTAARNDRTREALELLRLEKLANASVHTLSGGEAQRVALARALALEPDVLLLDEPTANLDVTMRRELRRDIENAARQRARAVVLITHDAGEAFGLADRVAVLHDGVIVQSGAPDDLVLRPATPFIAELTGAELLLQGRVDCVEDGLIGIRVGGSVTLWAVSEDAEMSPGTDAVIAYRPEDIMLAAGDAHASTSAVNRIAAQVEALVPAGALMRVRLNAGAVRLIALVTRRSVDAMRLAPGVSVDLVLKAAALHAWRRRTHQ